MIRRSIKMAVLAGLLLVTLAVPSFAAKGRHAGSDLAKITDYALTGTQSEKSNDSRSVLGAYAADGGSPGAIVGRTWRDDQAHLSPGHFTGWRGNTTPQIHFSYGAQACAGYTNPNTCARWLHYNMFLPYYPPGGIWVNGTNGIPLQVTPFIEGGAFAQTEVDETGHIIVIGEVMDAPSGADAVNGIKMFWDISPTGVWGTIQEDTLPYQQTLSTDLFHRQPRIAYQEYGGKYITHVVSLDNVGFSGTKSTREMYYFRREADNTGPTDTPGGDSWTSMIVTDSVQSNHYAIGVAQDGDGEVCLVWVGYYGQSGHVPIWVMRSYNAGETWNTKVNIIPFDDDWQPWVECDALIDRDGFTHVIWPAGEVDLMRIFHWTDRLSGDVAGGKTSLIDILDFNGLEDMCGRFGRNLLGAGKQMLSECNGRLYATWMQAGDPDRGDSTDCSDETAGLGFVGSYNGDIYMSISSSLDGSLWDARRNITNSKTPGCDGTDPYPCDHDNYPSPARVGMNTSQNSVGMTYWWTVPEAFEVRDYLDASYPDTGWYIDLQYINDIFPGIAHYNDNILWTNNPIKWFRLPCVPPIIDPELFIAQKQMTHPNFWVKSGESYELDVEIMNMGNATLSVSNVTPHDVQGTGWYSINTTSLTIEPASSDYISITLNPGLIDPGPGNAYGIEAWFLVDCNDPNNSLDSFLINTVITDTVVPYTYDIIRTGLGVPMGPANIGTAGNYPHTGGYMQFYEEYFIDLDCDSQNVYLHDMTPVVMTDPSTGWWAPYYDSADPDSNNFVPILGEQSAESCSPPGMEQFLTGDFVTSDSAIGMNKAWAAPSDGVSFVIERWEIFSRDGSIHYGVQLGEYLDIDVPSDTGINNFGAVIEADDYIWMSGQESNAESCETNDGRFYAAGLLGWYYTSEYAYDPGVNHTGLAGAYVNIHPTLMDNKYRFVPDSLWEYMTNPRFLANNSSWDDQRAFLAYGGFDIKPNDTLVIWTVHGSLIRSTETDVANQIAAAKTWYMDYRDDVGDCDWYICGNIDNTLDGKVNLGDITRMIDFLYISKISIDFPKAAETDLCEPVNIADLILLIDHVYCTKNPICVGGWDCNPSMPHDVVRLTVSHRPNIAEGDSSIVVDLYVRNTVDLTGVTIGFTWDSPKLTSGTFDTLIAPASDNIRFFEVHESTRYAQFDAISANYDFHYWLFTGGLNNGVVDEYLHWASIHFTVENWLTTDSVTFDLINDTTKFVTIPYDVPGILGYTPRWDGPVVARDAGAYGDVDGSGTVDIGDVVEIIDYLFLDGALTRPSDIGNANSCDGTDVADLRYIINMLFEGAPPVSESSCDFEMPNDMVGLRFTNWPEEGTAKFRADQPLELELFVRNEETVTDATMTFSWDNEDLTMDSATAGSVAITGFPQSIVLYENNLLNLTNAGQLFNFKGSAGQTGSGVPGDPTALRLWATYYFTLTNWEPGDEVMIDTMVFSDGSAFKLVNDAGEGHTPIWQWQPPYACCGVYTNGFSGNVDWHQDMVGTKCDTTGARNLADITRLIDHVYVSKAILCCPKNGNVYFTYFEGTTIEDGKINLSDITRLIDKVYVSKIEVEPCQ